MSAALEESPIMQRLLDRTITESTFRPSLLCHNDILRDTLQSTLGREMAAMVSSLGIENISSERLHASTRLPELHHAPLSIIDATVGGFGATEMILLYDASENGILWEVEQLKDSLRATLNSYPQWCGCLRLSDYDPASTSHLRRFGRFVLSYGGDDEPGVEFVVAQTATVLDRLVPTAEDRAKTKIWNATNFPGKELVPLTLLSQNDLDNPNAPSLIVQLTHFKCGGVALAVKMAHPLSDAHCLSYFMRDWAEVTRAIACEKQPPILSPHFDPQSLDRMSSGDVDASSADPSLVHRARGLPCHRYDWWASAADCPFPTTSKEVPEALRSQPHDEEGEMMPWSTWDLNAQVEHLVLHFSCAELQEMQNASKAIENRVSKQDAVVAHVWKCVNRARDMFEDDEPVYLDYTLGLRSRTSPPLGERFLGSPILLTAIKASGREAAAEDSGAELAARVRRTVAEFTPDAVAAHFHDKAYDQCPQRLWQTFLGQRHLLTTSWIRTGVYTIDFGRGAPRYIEAVMPKMDGLFQIMEAKPQEGHHAELQRPWRIDGVDCHLYLAQKTAESLAKDSFLRKFDRPAVSA
jgi:hypothetical protein